MRHLVFGFFTFFLLTGCGHVSPQTGQDVEITAMTYNIRIGAGPGESLRGDDLRANMEDIAAYLQESDADVILLQEVDRNAERSAMMDQAQYLADALDFDSAFAPALEHAAGEYGIALLSRWPIIGTKTRELFQPDYSESNPGFPSWYSEQRVALSARVATPWGALAVMNTHLGVTQDQREVQLREVAGLIDDVPESLPLIFGGDLNAEPDASALEPVRQRLDSVYQLSPQVLPVSQRLTYPALEPERLIDYLFVRRPGIEVLDTSVDDVALSDHLPVVAHLQIDFQR